jgi:glycerophosphoryl diester phosphodiesterase
VSFFSNKDGLFIILKRGLKTNDGSIQFSGFWRYSERKDQGSIQFSITAANGATDLLNGIVNHLIVTGANAGNDMQLQYTRPFSATAISKGFMIMAHHGVLTTSDPPYAENSLLSVLNDEDYGVTGLEFDVRMTKDNVPICIHDPTINTRLTQKGPLSGSWDQYSFDLISSYIRLVDGQKVPSVEQALNAFIDSTNLGYFWMDVKGNTDVFKYLEPVVRRAYARATAINRKVVIFAGLPSAEVIDELHKQPSYADLPTLCEQSLQLALDNKSKYFGPRFSEGLLLDDVTTAHANGIKVISWTLNDKGLIKNYLQNGQFDGFITDYPAYVVYDFYTMF